MSIGIDASRAFLAKRTGIEEYSYQVIKHLRNELADDRVVLYVRKGHIPDFDLPKSWRVQTVGWSRLWTQGGLALEMLFHPVDALFVPAHTVPWAHPKKTVVTVHGLEYEFCPEAYSQWERLYMRWSIKNSCRWASKVIAVSENTKRDLARWYHVPVEKIAVIHEGVSDFLLKSEIRAPRADDSSGEFLKLKPYFLFIGRIEVRKNVARTIEAFDLFKKKHGTNHRLVLAGKPGYGYDRVKLQIQNSKYQNDIAESGYVGEKEKWRLLRNASGFLFPSLYEGFGLPVLEAQSVGVPVLTSKTSSLPEVSGADSAVLVDPLSVEDIARGIEKIALDSDFRSAIIESGLKNMMRFGWETCAKQVARELVDGK